MRSARAAVEIARSVAASPVAAKTSVASAMASLEKDARTSSSPLSAMKRAKSASGVSASTTIRASVLNSSRALANASSPPPTTTTVRPLTRKNAGNVESFWCAAVMVWSG
jgi:hypothetical protein